LSTFLLLEDDELVCELLGRMLESSGRRILKATDDVVALEHARTAQLDILVTDLARPSAFSIVERLRALQPRLRVLYMCNWADNGMSARVWDASVVLKPFTVAELETAVARALNGGAVPSPAAVRGGAR
jgi:DNA-binding response OmpR family regulator